MLQAESTFKSIELHENTDLTVCSMPHLQMTVIKIKTAFVWISAVIIITIVCS